MSKFVTIRGTSIDADIIDLATEDDGLSTDIVGFFDANFPRGNNPESDDLASRARDRATTRTSTPQTLLRK